MQAEADRVRAEQIRRMEGMEEEVLLETPLSASLFTGYTRLYVPVALSAPGHVSGEILRVRLGSYDGSRCTAELL